MFPAPRRRRAKIIEEKFYYAKLADNPLVFEVKGEKLADVLFDAKPAPPDPKDPLAKLDPPTPGRAVDQLRDPNPIRFESEQVVGVTIQRPGQTLELTPHQARTRRPSRRRPARTAGTSSPRSPAWPKPKQVTDLLDALEKLSAKKNEIVDLPVAQLLPRRLRRGHAADGRADPGPGDDGDDRVRPGHRHSAAYGEDRQP